ncbi:hypothetical protein GCM10009765_09490 [Fodinicola feengrottensis]|uniref:Fibronectin type-III domain-containing protein n=1 Tax=Fodinicola feengrottensis TaxID=435914 RepID=A0ABN2FZJ7_9ACTN
MAQREDEERSRSGAVSRRAALGWAGAVAVAATVGVPRMAFADPPPTLVIPTLVGPVSELCTTVRVQGALKGAHVTVESIGAKPRVVAQQIAKFGGDERLTTLSPLRSDDLLVAYQEVGADKSSMTPTDMAMGVQPAPVSLDEIGYLGALTHLFQCGRYVWITGAIPGATIEVSFSGVVQAQGTAYEGEARLTLAAPISAGSPVSLRQITPIGPGPTVPIMPDQLPATLSAPTVQAPLVSCQTAVLVTDVLDGAQVTLTHKSGVTQTAGFDRSALWMGVQPLVEGDTIAATQVFPQPCNKTSPTNPSVRVVAPDKVDPPSIIGPLCAGSNKVRVANYAPGATISLQIDSTVYRGMPPAAGSYDFQVDPLPAGANVQVRQEICGVIGKLSEPPLGVDSHQDVTKAATIHPKLHACGRGIWIADFHQNSLVQAWAQHGTSFAPISEVIVAREPAQQFIPVTPYLRQGDQVVVREWACSTQKLDSAALTVLGPDSPGPPQIPPTPTAESTVVTVINVVSGALVEVFLQESANAPWQFIGSAVGMDEDANWLLGVPVNVRLPLDGLVKARQAVCGMQTEFGAAVKIIRGKPGIPVLDTPVNIGNQPLRPSFRWHDPYAGDSRRASSFIITAAVNGGAAAFSKEVTSTSYSPDTDLLEKTTYWWTVKGKNSSGDGVTSQQALFDTGPKPTPPPPPPPVLTGYDVNTLTLKGTGFKPSGTVYVFVAIAGWIPGNSLYDLRYSSPLVQCTADATGNLSARVDPKTAVPPIYVESYGTYLYGAWPGEKVSFTAHDANANVESNTFTVTA